MRSAIILTLAAVAMAQVSEPSSIPSYTNPMTSFLTQTNSLGVVTGQPKPDLNVVTSQPLPVTTQPALVTSQPPVETSPAGSNIVSVPTAAPYPTSAVSSGYSSSMGTNATFTSGSPSASSTGASETSSEASSSATATDDSAATTTGSAAPTASTGAAALFQPALGLGVAGAIFAAFL
jgi:hypothetical protein